MSHLSDLLNHALENKTVDNQAIIDADLEPAYIESILSGDLHYLQKPFTVTDAKKLVKLFDVKAITVQSVMLAQTNDQLVADGEEGIQSDKRQTYFSKGNAKAKEPKKKESSKSSRSPLGLGDNSVSSRDFG